MSWKFLHNPEPNKHYLGLCLVAGILIVLYWAQVFNLGEVYGSAKVVSGALLFGTLLGLILPWIGALVHVYGLKLLPGTSEKPLKFNKAYSFIGHSLRPMKWLGLVQLIELVFFGEEVFFYKWDFFFVVKTMIILATIAFWFLYSKRMQNTRKGWPVMAGLSICLGMGTAIFLFWGIFGLPMFA